MNKTFLFSPLGGTDPISQTNCRDGSMLHICRFLKPDKVFLYLSKEMVDYERADHRYTYCLNELMKLQERTFEVELIERPDLVDVQDYDFFYTEFSVIINRIMTGEMDGTDTLILNIASGTPAMKSALAVMKTISEYPCRLIQVTTPTKSMNIHDNSGYDPVLMWECDEDNRPDAKNRCVEITLPSLALMKKEEIIKMHIRAYDYRAAMQVASTLPSGKSAAYIDLIKMAEARLGFDLDEARSLEGKTGCVCLPVKKRIPGRQLEYALILEIKLRKHEYADFLRALTPLIVDLFEMVLESRCGFKVDDYCDPDSKKQYEKKVKYHQHVARRWSREKFGQDDIGQRALAALDSHYGEDGFRNKDVSSDHLKVLVDEFCMDQGMISIVSNLRNVEIKVRNLAAHELDSFNEDKIYDLTGLSTNKIMQQIRSLFGFLSCPIPSDVWDSYDKMNEMIIGRM